MDVSVAVGNQLLFTSTTLTVDTVAAIVVKLPGSESTALASENCLREDVTQSPPPPPHSDLCRWELIDACHDYSVVVQVQFRNESVVDIYRHLKAHPGSQSMLNTTIIRSSSLVAHTAARGAAWKTAININSTINTVSNYLSLFSHCYELMISSLI